MYPLTHGVKSGGYDPSSYGCTTHGLELSAGLRGRAWGLGENASPIFFRNWVLYLWHKFESKIGDMIAKNNVIENAVILTGPAQEVEE